ncbi:MAG TPA: helix-turn-helix domain-containing protein [Streptosporangiaceae bacterium]|nr:helix-turn-helix domain-containing protein [Streptosporangiaceae bacterium]
MATEPDEGDDLSARERILATAEGLFAERGFDRTSTARIAEAAGVPHGLIFYHFKTKMDLLLAVTRDDRLTALDDVVPPLPAGLALEPAVAALWERLSCALGEPSAIRKIILQEAGAHPEIQARAREYQDRISSMVAAYLARATGTAGPGPAHEAAARLLTVTAGTAPLVGEPGAAIIPAADLAALIAAGLS